LDTTREKKKWELPDLVYLLGAQVEREGYLRAKGEVGSSSRVMKWLSGVWGRPQVEMEALRVQPPTAATRTLATNDTI
jgi:hypothetical protein